MGALIVRRHPGHPIGWLLSRREPALGHAGRGGLRRSGCSTAVAPVRESWGHLALVGGTAARLAGLHRAGAGLPPRTGRPPALAPVALGRLGHRRRARPAHAGDVDHAARGLRLRPARQRPRDHRAAAHRRVDAGRRRPRSPPPSPSWCGCGAPATTYAASCCGSPSAAALLAVGVVVILVVPRITGVEGTWAAALPLRMAQVAVPLCVAVAVLRHRLLEIDADRQPRRGPRPRHRARRRRLRARRRDRRPRRGRGTNGFWPSLLATAAGRARLPAPAKPGGPGGRPAGLRRCGRAVRSARRLQPAPRRAALTRDAAAGGGRGGRARGQRDPGDGRARTSRPAPTRRRTGPPTERMTRRSPGLEMPVLHHGERLGSITVTMPAGHPLRPPRAPAARRPGRPGRTGLPQRAAHRRAVGSGGAAGPPHPRAERVPPSADQRRRCRAEPTRAGHRRVRSSLTCSRSPSVCDSCR